MNTLSELRTRRWWLVADIGGTNARFGLVEAGCELQMNRYYSVADHDTLECVLTDFLNDVAVDGRWCTLPDAACIAVAGPAEPAVIRFTNSPWIIERDLLRNRLGGAELHIINDFAAVGYAVAQLKESDWLSIGGGTAIPGRPAVVAGAGTGLGVCTLVPFEGGYRVLEGEGGHVDFGATNAREYAVLQILTARYGRISAERLLSGAGILNIYTALAQIDGHSIQHTDPAAVTAAALTGDLFAVQALEMFCGLLGAFAGNLALTVGARGGVYIAGGIAPRFTALLARSSFRERFEDKGRLRAYLAGIPVRIVLKNDLGLSGAIDYLQQKVGIS